MTHPTVTRSGRGFDDLRREMDALLGRFGAAPGSRSTAFPAANLYETGDGYVLTAELPGVAADQIELSIEGTTLTLGGERRLEAEREGSSAHRYERQSGRFRRAFELPLPVDADKVEVTHRNGVLLLQLPKQAQHQPRQISVRAG